MAEPIVHSCRAFCTLESHLAICGFIRMRRGTDASSDLRSAPVHISWFFHVILSHRSSSRVYFRVLRLAEIGTIIVNDVTRSHQNSLRPSRPQRCLRHFTASIMRIRKTHRLILESSVRSRIHLVDQGIDKSRKSGLTPHSSGPPPAAGGVR